MYHLYKVRGREKDQEVNMWEVLVIRREQWMVLPHAHTRSTNWTWWFKRNTWCWGHVRGRVCGDLEAGVAIRFIKTLYTCLNFSNNKLYTFSKESRTSKISFCLFYLPYSYSVQSPLFVRNIIKCQDREGVRRGGYVPHVFPCLQWLTVSPIWKFICFQILNMVQGTIQAKNTPTFALQIRKLIEMRFGNLKEGDR